MPIYEYHCDKCRTVEDHVARVDEHLITCVCGGTMHRKFHCNYGINMGVGAYGYFDETLGKYINSNKQHREVMREQGVAPRFGKGWT